MHSPNFLSSPSNHHTACICQMDNKLLRNKLQPRDHAASRSQPSSPLTAPSRLGFSPNRSRKSSATEPSRKPCQSKDNALLRGRWPSSSSSSSSSSWSSKKPINSLGDYLRDESPSGPLDRKGDDKSSSSSASGLQSLSRMRSCSELNRFEEHKEEEQSRKISKENRPFGTSMRYIGKLRFPKSSSSPPMLPGRMSVDENALANRRKINDFAADFPSSESSDMSDTIKGMSPKIPRATSKDSGPKSVDRTPTAKLAAAAEIRRTSSLIGKGVGMSPWALSPGRRSSSPLLPPPVAVAAEGGGTPSRSFSSLGPGSPDKTKKMGNIISIGLDLFRRKSGSASNKPRPSSPVVVVGDVGHQFRILHNCFIQWSYVNARANSTNQTRTNIAETTLMSAWAEIARLQASVMQKMVQLEREKLNFKLNRLITWQMNSLEGWGEIEREHVSALSATQNCLQAAVQRLPLVDRAKADPQLLAIRLRQATNLTATINSTLGMHASVAQNTVPLLSELAQVAVMEKTQIDECLEMLGMVSSLQIQEESLRCHLVQLKSTQQENNISVKDIF